MQSIWQQWSAYLFFCFDAPYSAPVCQPFWIWVAGGSVAIAGTWLLWFVWKIVDYKLKYRAALFAELERERVAEVEVMDSVKWIGDEVALDTPHDVALDSPEGDAALAQSIREALGRRKARLDKPSL